MTATSFSSVQLPSGEAIEGHEVTAREEPPSPLRPGDEWVSVSELEELTELTRATVVKMLKRLRAPVTKQATGKAGRPRLVVPAQWVREHSATVFDRTARRLAQTRPGNGQSPEEG